MEKKKNRKIERKFGKEGKITKTEIITKKQRIKSKNFKIRNN